MPVSYVASTTITRFNFQCYVVLPWKILCVTRTDVFPSVNKFNSDPAKKINYLHRVYIQIHHGELCSYQSKPHIKIHFLLVDRSIIEMNLVLVCSWNENLQPYNICTTNGELLFIRSWTRVMWYYILCKHSAPVITAGIFI